MIRNVIILEQNGQLIFAENFGECHSLPNEPDMAEMLSGFISALYSFTKNLSNQDVSEVNFRNLHLYTKIRRDFVFVLAVDDDMSDENKKGLNTIAELFIENYGGMVDTTQPIDQAMFQDFPRILLEKGIVQDNCGDYENCIGCPNSGKSLPVKDLIHTIQQKRDVF